MDTENVVYKHIIFYVSIKKANLLHCKKMDTAKNIILNEIS